MADRGIDAGGISAMIVGNVGMVEIMTVAAE